ncbi:MAG: glutathione S-transferase N-terminal domain-containing protein [Caulobacteraceae bacterium]|nr:glutathione S-transferase N-terminal domain-containing protein [Caulobacteraceae bacterium]
MFRLYYAPGACSLVPHVALEEIGVAFEPVRLDLAGGEQRREAYLALNPQGRVPTLITDRGALTEVIGIVTFLHRAFPDAGLLPADAFEAGRALELMSWFASTLHPAFAQTARPHRFVDDPAAAAGLAEPGRRRFLAALDRLESFAESSGGWLAGSTFSMADVHGLVMRRWAERLGADPAQWPAWNRAAQRALARESVQRALAREAAPVSAAA